MEISRSMKAFIGSVVGAALCRIPEIERDPQLYLKKIEQLLEFYGSVRFAERKEESDLPKYHEVTGDLQKEIQKVQRVISQYPKDC